MYIVSSSLKNPHFHSIFSPLIFFKEWFTLVLPLKQRQWQFVLIMSIELQKRWKSTIKVVYCFVLCTPKPFKSFFFFEEQGYVYNVIPWKYIGCSWKISLFFSIFLLFNKLPQIHFWIWRCTHIRFSLLQQRRQWSLFKLKIVFSNAVDSFLRILKISCVPRKK